MRRTRPGMHGASMQVPSPRRNHLFPIIISWYLIVCGMVGDPSIAVAQRPRDVVLIFPPIPDDRSADSAYVVAFAAELRNSLYRWRQHAVRTIRFCRESVLCDELPPSRPELETARMLQADFYVIGKFRRDTVEPGVDLRVMETARQGGIPHYTASINVQTESDMPPKDFARVISGLLKDTLQAATRAARDARDCWAKVRDRNYDDARARAERAFTRFPNHASAAMCVSYVHEAVNQPDSVIWALERAVAGDSMLVHAWGGLALEYLRRGDTTRAVNARIQEVQADPDDVRRRLRVAQVVNRLGHHGAAVELVRGGVDDANNALEFHALLARMCVQYEMWECALESLTEQYALDSSLAGDTTFYFQVIGVAQSLIDTAAVAHWTREAVTRVDSVVRDAWERAERQRRSAERAEEVLQSLRMARANALGQAGERDSALAIYRAISMADPENIRARIAAARLLTRDDFLVLEPTVYLDTQALRTADSLLTTAAEKSVDDRVQQTVAILYLEVGTRLVQDRVAPAVALEWLEKALHYAPNGALHDRGRALSGLAIFYLVEDLDTRLRVEQTCELVGHEAELIARGIAVFQEAQDEFAEQILAGLRAYEELIPAYRRALRCDDTALASPDLSTLDENEPGRATRVGSRPSDESTDLARASDAAIAAFSCPGAPASAAECGRGSSRPA